MVQVSGTTYRIVERALFNEVFRITDNRRIGAFRHGPALEVMESEIPREALLVVARHALRNARLSWPPRSSRHLTLWFRSLRIAGSVLMTVFSALNRFTGAFGRIGHFRICRPKTCREPVPNGGMSCRLTDPDTNRPRK
jgi:hypothetical protein